MSGEAQRMSPSQILLEQQKKRKIPPEGLAYRFPIVGVCTYTQLHRGE